MRRFRIIWVTAVSILTGTMMVAQAKLTKDEALALHFPGMSVERSTIFLTEDQQAAIQRAARARVESKVVTTYVARHLGRVAGTAFFETMTVRTMPATIMVVVDPDTSIRVVELLAFTEPPDYQPSARWMSQFAGRTPADDLYLKRGVHAIAGATITAQTITDGVRRLLATYTIVVAPRITP
jgi:Na+-translocating ferredoxin:NAD+ oxidoreductase RnfG subunit